jgi:hypothetical protein
LEARLDELESQIIVAGKAKHAAIIEQLDSLVPFAQRYFLISGESSLTLFALEKKLRITYFLDGRTYKVVEGSNPIDFIEGIENHHEWFLELNNIVDKWSSYYFEELLRGFCSYVNKHIQGYTQEVEYRECVLARLLEQK